MEMRHDWRWASEGIDSEFLKAKADWLRERRGLGQESLSFFELAGALVFYSQFDYPLGSLAFFQAAIGVERALKLRYGVEDDRLSDLLARAVKDRLVRDSIFSDIPSVSEFVLEAVTEEVRKEVKSDVEKEIRKEVKRQIRERFATHSERLALIIPRLRNQFFHGTYLLGPRFLYLTLQLRQIADALFAKKGVRIANE